MEVAVSIDGLWRASPHPFKMEDGVAQGTHLRGSLGLQLQYGRQ